jgi:hypothetical protein
MNINSNALAHEIAPRWRSLVSRRNPACGSCYFAPNICSSPPLEGPWGMEAFWRSLLSLVRHRAKSVAQVEAGASVCGGKGITTAGYWPDWPC